MGMWKKAFKPFFLDSNDRRFAAASCLTRLHCKKERVAQQSEERERNPEYSISPSLLRDSILKEHEWTFRE